jgi:hypothetical protein
MHAMLPQQEKMKETKEIAATFVKADRTSTRLYPYVYTSSGFFLATAIANKEKDRTPQPNVK